METNLQTLEKKKKTHKEYGEYNEISKLELHEVTICEKGINPEAKFDILKEEKDKMSEKLEIAEALGPESARCAACCFLPRLAWQPGNDEYRNRLVLMMTS